MMKYRVLYCFQKHSIRLAADPAPRPVSCSGIGVGGEAVTGPGCCRWFEPKAMQTCSEHSARACASAAAAAPAPALGCGFKVHDAGCSEKAKKPCSGEPSLLGLTLGNPEHPNQLGETPRKPYVVQDCREAECCSRDRGLRHNHAGTAGYRCWPGGPTGWAVRGAAEHSGLVSLSRAALQRQAGAWAKTALSHAGMSAEPVARASTVPAEAGHCWRDCAEMRAPRARGGLPNCWSHLPF